MNTLFNRGTKLTSVQLFTNTLFGRTGEIRTRDQRIKRKNKEK